MSSSGIGRTSRLEAKKGIAKPTPADESTDPPAEPEALRRPLKWAGSQPKENIEYRTRNAEPQK